MEGLTTTKRYVVLLEITFGELVLISIILLSSCMSGFRYKRKRTRNLWTKMEVTKTKHRTALIATMGERRRETMEDASTKIRYVVFLDYKA